MAQTPVTGDPVSAVIVKVTAFVAFNDTRREQQQENGKQAIAAS